jgi:hypothetical protein
MFKQTVMLMTSLVAALLIFLAYPAPAAATAIAATTSLTATFYLNNDCQGVPYSDGYLGTATGANSYDNTINSKGQVQYLNQEPYTLWMDTAWCWNSQQIAETSAGALDGLYNFQLSLYSKQNANGALVDPYFLFNNQTNVYQLASNTPNPSCIQNLHFYSVALNLTTNRSMRLQCVLNDPNGGWSPLYSVILWQSVLMCLIGLLFMGRYLF